MNKNIMLILCAFALALGSCQKEVDSPGIPVDPPVVPPVKDSSLITKIISLDSSKTAPFDTINVITIVYDNQKRWISQLYLDYKNGIVDSGDHYRLLVRNYNGTDTVPYKMIDYLKDGTNRTVDTCFYSYQNGLLVRDSLLYKSDINAVDQYAQVDKYVHSAGSVKETSYFYKNFQLTGSDNTEYFFTKQNGNIVSQTNTRPGSINTFSCTYDNHKNPFTKNRIDAFGGHGFLPARIGDGDANPTYYSEPNNVTEINNNDGGPYTTHYQFSYKYNAEGYPSQVTLKNLGTGTLYLDINKMLFKYSDK